MKEERCESVCFANQPHIDLLHFLAFFLLKRSHPIEPWRNTNLPFSWDSSLFYPSYLEVNGHRTTRLFTIADVFFSILNLSCTSVVNHQSESFLRRTLKLKRVTNWYWDIIWFAVLLILVHLLKISTSFTFWSICVIDNWPMRHARNFVMGQIGVKKILIKIWKLRRRK